MAINRTLLAAMIMGCFLFGLLSTAGAASINDFDLNNFNFDVTSYEVFTSNGAGVNGAIASGTSNGIGWTITKTSLWNQRTTTNGSFKFDALPITTDNLHVGTSFTITFDTAISSLLVAVDNNGGTDSINLGLPVTDSFGVVVDGTQIMLKNNGVGGLVLYENINSLSITFIENNVPDGFDFAFHAIAVPVPSAIFFLGMGATGLACIRRRG